MQFIPWQQKQKSDKSSLRNHFYIYTLKMFAGRSWLYSTNWSQKGIDMVEGNLSNHLVFSIPSPSKKISEWKVMKLFWLVSSVLCGQFWAIACHVNPIVSENCSKAAPDKLNYSNQVGLYITVCIAYGEIIFYLEKPVRTLL